AVEGCAADRQPARHAHGAERVRRLLEARSDERTDRSEVVHHCHLRALRLRELLVDRHPDRRHRRARAEPAARPRAARAARDVRRHARQLHDRDDRRVPALMDYYDQVSEAAAAVRARVPAIPDAAIILGSGLGDFANALGDAVTLPYADLPHWPASRVIGHDGKLVVGTTRGRRIAALAGRCHLYEGHDVRTVTFAVRVLGVLGVKTLIVTNAAG